MSESGHSADRPSVTIVVPAFNAAKTIEATLASVTAQTFAAWEAIVVDDGSRDATRRICAGRREREPRIRVVEGTHGGVSAARNLGLAQARGDWVLFLDADDVLEPDHLARLMRAVMRSPDADVLYGGWRDVSVEGEGAETAPEDLSEAFAVAACRAPFAIHAALVRKTAIDAAGRFDETLSIAEDWDLWQRIARRGARFVRVDGLYARYTIRPDSASADLRGMLDAGLAVIRRGHGPDPRVRDPDPRHAAGTDPAGLPAALLVYAIWMMGAALGRGQGGRIQTAVLQLAAGQEVSAHAVAGCLAAGVARTAGAHARSWFSIWPRVEAGAGAFLRALEARSGVPGLARRTERRLEQMLAAQTPAGEPGRLGGLLVTTIDLDEPLKPVWLERGVERVRCIVTRGGELVGRFELAASGSLSAERLAAVLEADFDAAPAIAPPLAAATQVARRVKAWLGRHARRGAASQIQSATPNAQGEPAPSSVAYWDQVFAAPDPWSYGNAYERLKYQQTLEAIPPRAFGRALELACAEGHFTVDLASRVERLVATDISPTALERASARCAHHANIEFRQLDLASDPIPGPFDLIVCSEVLYYIDDLDGLARRIAAALAEGGILVMAHANIKVDEPDETGFAWPHRFGAKGIGEVFTATPGLSLASEFRTELYRIQVFTKSDHAPGAAATITTGAFAADLPTEVAAMVSWKAGAPAGPSPGVPILAYHRVAAEGPEALAPFRVSPEEFEAQLAWLADEGYSGVTLDQLEDAAWMGTDLPAKPVLITFDDGYRDVLASGLPILRHYGFPATIFLVSGKVGGSSDWDARFGPPADLLDWAEIEAMAAQGVSFGAHGRSHRSLLALSPDELAGELARCRADIEARLGRCAAVAYPYGDYDEAVGRAALDAGFRLGFTCDDGAWSPGQAVLALPRLTVEGGRNLDAFVRLIAA